MNTVYCSYLIILISYETDAISTRLLSETMALTANMAQSVVHWLISVALTLSVTTPYSCGREVNIMLCQISCLLTPKI